MVPLTLVAGEKLEAPSTCTPEGLRNATAAKLTPARLSVADTLTATLAGPDAVSMVVGVKLNAVRAGGVTSWSWAEEYARNAWKKVATNTSATWDERGARQRDVSRARVRYIGFPCIREG
jgi:hypothetical protein